MSQILVGAAQKCKIEQKKQQQSGKQAAKKTAAINILITINKSI